MRLNRKSAIIKKIRCIAGTIHQMINDIDDIKKIMINQM